MTVTSAISHQPGHPNQQPNTSSVPCPQIISGEMDESMFSIAIQSFHTLTELCQGPCPGNQAALVSGNVTGNVNQVLQLDFKDRCACPGVMAAGRFADVT